MPRCQSCEYDLEGLAGPSPIVCPECGTEQPLEVVRARDLEMRRACLIGSAAGAVPVLAMLVLAAMDTGWGRLGMIMFRLPFAIPAGAALAFVAGALLETSRVARADPASAARFRVALAAVPSVLSVLVNVVLAFVGAIVVFLFPGSGGC